MSPTLRCAGGDDESDESTDVESWLLHCEKSKSTNEIQRAVELGATSCSKAASSLFLQWCADEEVQNVVDLSSAWIAEPGLPTLPPEVSEVARLTVDAIPREHIEDWTLGTFKSVVRASAAKRRRLEAMSPVGRRVLSPEGHSARRRPAPSAQMVEATKKRLNGLTAALVAPAKLAAQRSFEELSLKAKYASSWEKEVKKCWAMLETLGECSPRWRELQDPTVPDSARDVQADLFGLGAKTEQVSANRREAESFLLWSNCARIGWGSATALQVASFLRDKQPQSSSAPSRALRGLKWLQRVSGMDLHAADSTVVSQAAGKRGGEKQDPMPAHTPTVSMLEDMEKSVWSAPTGPLRCVAGFICSLAWGCVRFHDCQHVNQMTLTRDSLLCRCYDMKGKKNVETFAVLRVGCTQRDWVEQWLHELNEHGLPGKDFVLLRPSMSATTFTMSVADYTDVNSAMRLLLQTHGFSVEDSLGWTLHSWRHLLPTMSRQLRHPNAETNEIGHWSLESGMAQRYDGALCCTELLLKADIRKALKDGWKVSAAGEVPLAKPKRRKRSSEATCSSPPEVVTPIRCANQIALQDAVVQETQIVLPTSVAVTSAALPEVQRVWHKVRNRVHLWSSERKSLCGMWGCGDPDDPTEHAVFASSSKVIPASAEKCRSCASRAARTSGWSAELDGSIPVGDDEEVIVRGNPLPEIPASPSSEASEVD